MGFNPYFGQFKRRFEFSAVPYGSSKKESFKNAIQENLKDIKYYFYNEIKLSITIYQNEQKRFETPNYADLDNYSKSICDGLKGFKGILIDDCIIQTLDICWIDKYPQDYFEIEIKSHPDEYIKKGIKLFEMPDRLFYPIHTDLKNVKETDVIIFNAIYWQTKNLKKFAHHLRTVEKRSKIESYYMSRGLKLILTGFHKTRIVDSGFDLIKIDDWMKVIKIRGSGQIDTVP